MKPHVASNDDETFEIYQDFLKIHTISFLLLFETYQVCLYFIFVFIGIQQVVTTQFINLINILYDLENISYKNTRNAT